MAQIHEVRLVDDIDGSEATETIRYGIDGKWREIDLNTDHAKALRESLAEFDEHARPAAASQVSAQPSRVRTRRSGTPSASREQNQAIRDWAAKRGIQVAERGRIARDIVAAFEAERGARGTFQIEGPHGSSHLG